MLKQVAQRLTSVIGERGQVGRLGGDEFEAVLPGQDDDGTLGALAARLIQQVSMPYMIEGHNISIGASVGIAIAPPVGSCADALIRNADLALYSAKAAGPRHLSASSRPKCTREAQDRQILETDLRKAIARGELQLQYQPVVNAQTEELSGFEALVRWHHPTRGVISPSLFIPLAEEAGLILSDRRMGASHRLPRSGEMARAYPGRGQSLADPVRRAEPARHDRQRARQRRSARRASSSWRSPRACSWSKANRPTTCSPS